MCSITAALIGVGTAASVAGGIKEGKAKATSAAYNATISKINAKRAEAAAKDAVDRGRLEESRKKAEGTLHRKEQEAAFTAGNIDAGYGSPMDLILATSREYAIDAALIRTSTEREYDDYRQQAANYRADAKMGMRTASNAMTSAVIGAVGTAASGGSKIITALG